MKKFSFSLEKILSFKQQNLDILMGEMNQLNEALKNTSESIKRTNEEYEKTGAEIEEKSSMGISLTELITYKSYLHSLIRKTDELMSAKVNIESAIERKKEEVIQAKGDIRGLEKLRDKQYREYQKLVQKKMEETVEEYVVQTSGK